jgi:hypothetical protein
VNSRECKKETERKERQAKHHRRMRLPNTHPRYALKGLQFLFNLLTGRVLVGELCLQRTYSLLMLVTMFGEFQNLRETWTRSSSTHQVSTNGVATFYRVACRLGMLDCAPGKLGARSPHGDEFLPVHVRSAVWWWC